MSDVLLRACKELIDDGKARCVDVVFKEVCLEVLARAKHVLDERQFKELVQYAAESIEAGTSIAIDAIQ